MTEEPEVVFMIKGVIFELTRDQQEAYFKLVQRMKAIRVTKPDETPPGGELALTLAGAEFAASKS